MQRELVERAARGDQEAFASLATLHVDRCYALAYRILRDPHRAHDATQQALLGAWRDLATVARSRTRSRRGSIGWSSMPATSRRVVTGAGSHALRVSVDEPVMPDLAKAVADRDLLEHAFAP